MRLGSQQKHWNRWGEEDPLWAILTVPGFENGQWPLEDFLASGQGEVEDALRHSVGAEIGQPSRALDFGCGVGRITLHLAKHFDHVDGVDIAPSMVERAKELARDREVRNIDYHVNARDDLAALFANESFDFIYANIVLQHMETRYGLSYVSEFVRVLRPAGTLVFQVPTAHPPVEGSRMAQAKQWVRRNAPERVMAAYDAANRAVRRVRTPAMEMHVYSEEDIRRVVSEAGGTTHEVLPDPFLDPPWRSRRFVVTRPR